MNYAGFCPLDSYMIGARQLVEDSGVESVTLIIGDGLKPLLQNNAKCDTVVVAGMGTSSIMQIISNIPSIELYGELKRTTVDSDSSYYTFERPRILDFTHLDVLGINRIITQPWPPNILPLHALHSNLLDNGWQFESQGIDVTCTSHVTTCFTRKKEFQPDQIYTDSEIFNLQPLAIKNTEGKLSVNEKKDFMDYLKKQKVTIDSKINGLEKTLQSSQAYRKKSETVFSSNSLNVKNVRKDSSHDNTSNSHNDIDCDNRNDDKNRNNSKNDNDNSNDKNNNNNNQNKKDINTKIALRSDLKKFNSNDPRSCDLSFNTLDPQIKLCKELSKLIETHMKY